MERDLDAIVEAARALAQGGKKDALEALAKVRPMPRISTEGRKLSLEDKVRTYHRDAFTCRYCGQKLMATPVLRVLSHLAPGSFPYHVNWKMDACHPLYWSLTPTADHVEAHALGGEEGLANLATACFRCNSIKGPWPAELAGLALKPVSEPGWDGGMSLLEAMARSAGLEAEVWVKEWLKAWKAACAA